MQSKLNEILELCIEKSGHQIGYFFYFNPMQGVIHIEKIDMSINEHVNFTNGSGYSEGKITSSIRPSDNNLDGIIECLLQE